MADYSVFYNLQIKDLASKQLERFKASIETTRKSLTTALTSGSAFAQLQNQIQGVVNAASPRTMAEWNASWYALQATVGRLFIPIMREASAKVIAVAKWIRELSDKQRENIAWWTKVALSLTGFFFLVSKVKPLLTGLFSVATSPFLLALTAATGLIGIMLQQMSEMEERSKNFVADLERMRSGHITESDMKKSQTGKELMAIADPAERAKQAQLIIDKETAREQEALKKWNEKSSLGMGASKLAQDYLGMNTDYSEMDKTQQDAKSNIGVATAIRDAALKGKDIDVKKDKKEGSTDMTTALMMNNSTKVSGGGVAEQWRSLQASITVDPQTQALKQVFGSVEAFRKDVNEQINKGNQNRPGSILPSQGGL